VAYPPDPTSLATLPWGNKYKWTAPGSLAGTDYMNWNAQALSYGFTGTYVPPGLQYSSYYACLESPPVLTVGPARVFPLGNVHSRTDFKYDMALIRLPTSSLIRRTSKTLQSWISLTSLPNFFDFTDTAAVRRGFAMLLLSLVPTLVLGPCFKSEIPQSLVFSFTITACKQPTKVTLVSILNLVLAVNGKAMS